MVDQLLAQQVDAVDEPASKFSAFRWLKRTRARALPWSLGRSHISIRMGRPLRIAAITAGLAATGAVAGAVLGVLIMALSILGAHSAAALMGAWILLLLGAGFGAAVGAVLAPASAWVLLRHVPLGRAVALTFLVATLGATLGMILSPNASIGGALVGFGAAAVWLRFGRSTRLVGSLP